MGRGDKKTRRGKISIGAYGKTRPRKSKATKIKTKKADSTKVPNIDSTKKIR